MNGEVVGKTGRETGDPERALMRVQLNPTTSFYPEQDDLPRRALTRRFLAFSECSDLHLDIS